MKKVLLTTGILFAATVAFAQKMTYKQKAQEITSQMWGNASAEFAIKDIPEAMRKESAVVLARSFDVQRNSGSRFKWAASGGTGSVARSEKTSIFHERVKINDKASLDEFSTLEYQKKLDKTQHFGVSKLRNKAETFIGIKIIKPNGEETIVNTSEEVLLKNDSRDQTGKLAVSGLQIGDVIDYYISTTEVYEGYSDNYGDNNYVFFLMDEYPVLSYKLDFKYSSKINVSFYSANGAPELTKTSNKDGDQILSIHLKNLPSSKGLIWSSPYRQYPYISVSGTFTAKGEDKKDSNLPIVDSYINNLETYYDARYSPLNSDLEDNLKNYYGGNKQLKEAGLSNSMGVMYDIWKHSVFCYYDGEEMDMSNERNQRSANSMINATQFSRNLLNMKIDHDVLLVASRFSAPLDAKKRPSALEFVIRINDTKPMYVFFDNVVHHFNEIPSEYQGEKAIVLTPKKVNQFKTTFTKGETVIPVTTSQDNNSTEILQVSLADDMKKLKITRFIKEKGALRKPDQISLLQMENIDRELTEMVKGKPLEKRLSKNYITKKMVDDYQAAFIKARADVKKNFSNEIKEHFDQEPQELSNFKINNSAIAVSKPVFEYTSTFKLDNLVKKAGNNFIVEAGKLTGGFLKLEEDARKRTVDIYMSSARTFNYAIDFAVPSGYTVKGLEEFNVNKQNSTGGFKSTASLNGNVLKINVERSYAHNFEKASDWPKLSEVIDAAYNFTNQKLLFEKIN